MHKLINNGMAFVNRVADLRLDLLAVFKGNWFAFVNLRQNVETQISHSMHKLIQNGMAFVNRVADLRLD